MLNHELSSWANLPRCFIVPRVDFRREILTGIGRAAEFYPISGNTLDYGCDALWRQLSVWYFISYSTGQVGYAGCFSVQYGDQRRRGAEDRRFVLEIAL